MCGRENEVLMHAIVEGSMLSVCKNCARFGNVIEVKKPEVKEKRIIAKEEPELIEYIVKDYAGRIKKAREARELTQENLAKNIAEKESVIHNLESGQLQPSLKLARKLEQFFQIKLIDEYKEEEAHKKKLDLKDQELTIGDLLRIRKK